MNLINSLKSFFSIALDVKPGERASILLIESPREIRIELERARNTRRIIGVYCPKIGDGIVLTKVEDIVGGDVLVRLFDLEGTTHDIIEIPLSQVLGVSPFNTSFTSSIQKKKRSAVLLES